MIRSYDLSRSVIAAAGEVLPLSKQWQSQKQLNIFSQIPELVHVERLHLALEAIKYADGITTIFGVIDSIVPIASDLPKALVIHARIECDPPTSQLALIGQAGVTILVSETNSQVQSNAALAYLACFVAPVLHVIHITESDIPQPVPNLDTASLHDILSNDAPLFKSIDDARAALAKHGLSAPAFQYFGAPASRVIVSFGASLTWKAVSAVDSLKMDKYGMGMNCELESSFVDELNGSHYGLLHISQLYPWNSSDFVKNLPVQATILHLLLPKGNEWNPLYVQVANSLSASNRCPELLLFDYGSSFAKYFEPKESHAILNAQVDPTISSLLHGIFQDSLKIFFSAGSSDVAFGSLLSELYRLDTFKQTLQELAQSAVSSPVVKDIISNILKTKDRHEMARLHAHFHSIIQQQHLEDFHHVLHEKSLFFPTSRWMIDDGSLLDLGSSLIHTILSSKEKINLLIIDHNPNDGVSIDFKNRRDASLYAMNYGGAYVASICPSYSFSQAAQALKEAAAFEGPSVVVLLAPKSSKSGKIVALEQVASCKRIIDSALFSLFRWTPSKGEEEPILLIDSSKPKASLEKFLEKNNNLALVLESDGQINNNRSDLRSQIATQVLDKAHESYKTLFGSLEKKKLLILFGSDGGTAEGVAKRLALEAKEKGLYVKIFAADSFVTEDLANESHVLFVVSTAGQGEFPGNCRETWKSLNGNAFDFPSVHYAVFALGDRHYWPRPEDAHYFAKSGKDLDAVLAKRGAIRLTDLGIGDDRDPDGYNTGLSQWAPGFWTALGVEAEAISTGSAVPTDDAIKAASNYLRGTIAEGLLDTTTGALAEYDTKLTKFHGIYQQDDRDIREHRARKGLEKAFSFMIRVRVPGGIATSAQYLAMDEISDKWANGTIKITTRQAFQFHGIVKSVLKRSMQDINRSLLGFIGFLL